MAKELPRILSITSITPSQQEQRATADRAVCGGEEKENENGRTKENDKKHTMRMRDSVVIRREEKSRWGRKQSTRVC